MDTRIIDLIKALAFEYTEPDSGGVHCPFCVGEELPAPVADKIKHDTHDCLTARARVLLRDMGTPLCLYKVAYEEQRADGEWHTTVRFFPAFSAQTVHDAFTSAGRRRDLRIEKVREL